MISYQFEPIVATVLHSVDVSADGTKLNTRGLWTNEFGLVELVYDPIPPDAAALTVSVGYVERSAIA